MTPNAESLADLIFRTLRAEGIRVIFGAPGTTELSLVEAADRHGIEYLFAHHDTVAVGMADGFARSTGRIAVANLHATQGLLNAAGFIRVAQRDHVPLLVLAGLPATTYDVFEPNHHLRGIEQILAPITKWGWTGTNASTLPQALGRALAAASAPPAGPTFLCVPQDLLEASAPPLSAGCDAWSPGVRPQTAAAGGDIEHGARLSVEADHPLILAGLGSRFAVAELEALAEALGAPILAEALSRGPQIHGVYCRTDHPLFLGFFDVRDPPLRQALAKSDLLLCVGTRAAYANVLGPLPPGIRIVDIDESPMQIGRQHRVTLGLVGEVRPSVARLGEAVKAELARSSAAAGRAAARRTALAGEIAAERARRERTLAGVGMVGRPITGLQLARALAEALPRGTVLVDDSQSMGFYVKRHVPFLEAHSLYGSTASHLGWALPAALGVKYGRPSSLVACLVGDGSLLFGLQGLSTGAAHSIPLLVIVANNGGSVSLQNEIAAKWELSAGARRRLSFAAPGCDYALLARACGLAGVRVEEASHLAPELARGIEAVTAGQRGYLLEVVLSEAWEDWSDTWHVGDFDLRSAKREARR